MELILKREQAGKMLGGVKFLLTARVQLKSEDQDVIKKYKAEKFVLHRRQPSLKRQALGIIDPTNVVGGKVLDKLFSNITIGSLTSGVSFKCNDLGDILDHEEKIKEACKCFYTYLVCLQNFGGEERISYPTENSDLKKIT